MPPAAPLISRLLAWPRVRLVLVLAPLFAALHVISSQTPYLVWLVRTLIVAAAASAAFGLLERPPGPRPVRSTRWMGQVAAVGAVVVPAAWFAYWATTGDPAFWHDDMRLTGFVEISVTGLLFAPWIAVGALVRQRETLVEEQATRFALERSELERRAVDARLRLLQTQVQPHFLFNTLANVRALVRAGSPAAPAVLDSLIAYLRASMPHLEDSVATLGRELDLVRAYLELMHLRMPDRLSWTLHADPGAAALACPPVTLLTLVENAVRHGIDPSEDGGRIEIGVVLRQGRCLAHVLDTGVGLRAEGGGGTGLATLRERLALAFEGDAQVRVAGVAPHGVRAEIDIPARPAGPPSPPAP